jgi:hypothetical protein
MLTNMQMAFLTLKSNLVLFSALKFQNTEDFYKYSSLVFKTKKIICNCVILVMSCQIVLNVKNPDSPNLASMHSTIS